jgi:lipopolysaccharide biosynthesis protein
MMTLIRDIHKALADNDLNSAAKIGRRILEADPRYPQSLIAYVEALLAANPTPHSSANKAQPESLPGIPLRGLPVVSGRAGYDSSTPIAAVTYNPNMADEVACIAASDLFDRDWYRSKYLPDAPDRTSEILHYCQIGWRLRYDPSKRFSTSYYLGANPDVNDGGYNPLVHYLSTGRKEGRPGSPPVRDTLELQAEIEGQYVFWHKQRTDFIPIHLTAIAFYFSPSFSTLDNDEQWGKGLTERSNARPARRLPPGHHRSHQPPEFRYYDLSFVQPMKRQVKLAKNYMLDAFCFYWLEGETRFETPIQMFHADSSIDFKYCLCWVNDSWASPWDGLDQDTLREQRVHPAHDLAFIEHIAPYLRDPRYVRIAGKPLLIVYHPTLLPDPRAMAARWRQRCRELEIGEIHLAAIYALETVDPRACGFDAALEFGHSHMHTRPPSLAADGLAADIQGPGFDRRGLLHGTTPHPQTDYILYCCVSPGSFSNARKNLGDVALPAPSPRAFQQWTVNAIDDAARHFGNDGLVFINAWNGWAEGVHLEPCQEYGYAYLEAFRQARVRTGARQEIQDHSGRPLDASTVAIIVHAFYPEVLPEVFEMLARIQHIVQPRMVITTPYSKVEECATAARAFEQDIAPLIIGVENRGRDILPFFTAFEYMARAQCRIFCKLHTKRSLHREDGTHWRRRLFGSLLDPDRVPEVLDRLSRDTSVGIVAPDDHLLPMSTHWESNKRAVLSVSTRLGVGPRDVLGCPLVAGSMFWARTEALLPLYALVDSADFESEKGQTDGTMAHAIERLFSVGAHSIGLQCVDVSGRPFDYTADVECAFAANG